jgi:hypothetical protein
MYGSAGSPPCLKIICLLKHHQIEYTLLKGPKKDSEYKKVPVLMLNDRQINDSFIMVKNLSPILYGKALTEEELKFEEEMTFGLMNVLEARVIGNSTDMKNCA